MFSELSSAASFDHDLGNGMHLTDVFNNFNNFSWDLFNYILSEKNDNFNKFKFIERIL